jgi:peptidoglycan/LPS O-acetylase OafA/YrhL
MGKSRQRHRQAAAARVAAEQQRTHPATLPSHWPALTGLRGLAAVGVLFLHAFTLAGHPPGVPAPLAYLCNLGWSGVDVFFTLSAFLLALPFVQAQERGGAGPPLGEYWRHRAWRILPAYWVQVLLLFALALAGFAAASMWRSPDTASLLRNAFFLYNLVPGYGAAVPPWWTLPVELGFYLLLPWFARLLQPGRWYWLLLAIAASLAWRWWVMHAGFGREQQVYWADHLPGRLHQFVVGMLAAWAFVRGQAVFLAWSPLRRDLLGLGALAAFLALPMLGFPADGRVYTGAPSAHPLLLGWHLYASLAVAVLLLALASGPSRLARLFGAGWLQALGIVSYSLYLWHYPVMLALRDSLGGYWKVQAEFAPFLFYALLFSLLAAAASWWLVERPAQQRARRDKMPASTARA